MIQHNSHDPSFRVPWGAVPTGTSVTIRLRCDTGKIVVLRLWNGKETLYSMVQTERHLWEATVDSGDRPGLSWYDFLIYQRDGKLVRFGGPYDEMGGDGAAYEEGMVKSFQLTVYDAAYRTPGFLQGANIYQIFPDRFFRGKLTNPDDRMDRQLHPAWDEPFFPVDERSQWGYNSLEFWGGNLNGIREKLPYLQNMGVEILYLNPIFQASSNHRYDTGDFEAIDPLLGTEADFAALCQEAEALGIRVLLDGVFNHTGSDSRYFNANGTYDLVGAAQSPDSRYHDWYSFRRFPDEYACWWDFKSLPEVRKDHPDYRRFILGREGVIAKWLEKGASGWRLDVADELPMDFLRELRRAAKRQKRDAAVLGEVWEDASNKVAYGEMRCYCAGDTLDSVMNYPLREAILSFLTGKTNAANLVRLLKRQGEVYPAPFRYSLMNLLGSHDRARALNALVNKTGEGKPLKEREAITLTKEEYDLAVQRFQVALDILCAIPGCPTVYYGDEAGMTGAGDPYCRGPYPWGKEDRALQAYVREKLNARKRSPLLRYGHMDVTALDSDTLLITRYFDGKDGLGRKASEKSETITIRRPPVKKADAVVVPVTS